MTIRRRKRSLSQGPVPPEIIGAAVLAVHNLIVHRVLRPPADAALNVASAAALTAFALRIGCTPEELGLARDDLRRGLKIGAVGAATASAAVAIAAGHPTTRTFFHDARLEDISRRETIYHATLRIPIATALAEEIMFRSALHALFAREHSERATLAWTSLLFGLWHLLPTLDAFEGNPVSELGENTARNRRMAALGIAGATMGAGILFSYLRLHSRSVAAPVLTHAAFNSVAFVIGKTLIDKKGALRRAAQGTR